MAIVRHTRQFTQLQLEQAVGTSTINSSTSVVNGTIYYASDGDGIYYGYLDSGTAKLRRAAVVPDYIKIDGITANSDDGVNTIDTKRQFEINCFGTCSTGASTAAKTASISNGTPTLTAGCRVVVYFSNANTANSPTLNINSLGAKQIYHKNTQITSGANKGLLAGVVEFIYDGTHWALIGGDANTASLQVSDATNKKINNAETTGNYIQFTGGTNKFTVSDATGGTGHTFDVAVTPSIADNVTASNALIDGQIIVASGGYTIDSSGVSISTDPETDSSEYIITSDAVHDAIESAIGDLSGALLYKGTIGSSGATISSLPANHKVGDTYVVATAGTYAGVVCEVGDMIICKTTGTVASNADWTVVNGENQVTNSAPTITTVASTTSSPTKTTIATVDGTNLTAAVKHHQPSGASAGTAGTSSDTDGLSISIPYVTTDADGHVTAKGTHTHTIATGDSITYGNDGLDIVIDETMNGGGYQDEGGWKDVITLTSNHGPKIASGSDGVYIECDYDSIPAATSENDGYMTSTQATKLGGIASGAQVNVLEGVKLEGDSSDLTITSKKVTIPDMDGATSNANGKHGLVPQPLIANKDQFLKGDGTWATPSGTYSLPTATTTVKGGVKIGDGLEMVDDSSDNPTILTVKDGTDVWNDDTPDVNDWKYPYVRYHEYESGTLVSTNDLTVEVDSTGVHLEGYHTQIPAATAGNSAAASTDGYMTGTQAYALALATLYLQWEGES